MGCYIWYREEGTGWGPSPPRPLLTVPNVTARPSAASVPITVLLYNGPLLCGFNVDIKVLKHTSHRQISYFRLWRSATVLQMITCTEIYNVLNTFLAMDYVLWLKIIVIICVKTAAWTIIFMCFSLPTELTTYDSYKLLCIVIYFHHNKGPETDLTLYGHIKTTEQRTIIQQYGDWYSDRWWAGCYIWYSEEGLGGLEPHLVPSSLYQM